MARKHTLFIIDGDEEFIKTVCLVLSPRFECRHALTGEAALGADLDACDVVLLEIDLGHGMDGFQVLEELQARRRHPPRVVCTGRDEQSAREKALRLGAVDYLVKGSAPGQLAACLEAALGIGARGAQK